MTDTQIIKDILSAAVDTVNVVGGPLTMIVKGSRSGDSWVSSFTRAVLMSLTGLIHVHTLLDTSRILGLLSYDDRYGKLCQGQPMRVFHPLQLTKSPNHFAAKVDGVDGYIINDVRGGRFSPAVNVAAEFSVAKLICWSLRLRYDVQRYDEYYVDIIPKQLYLSKVHVSANVEFVQEMAVRGYFTEEGVPRVQIQVSPYVQADVLLSEYEELRIRTGKTPNLGYMQRTANLSNMTLTVSDITKIGQALKEEYRVLTFEPWIRPRCEDPNDGDVVVQLVQEEGPLVDLVASRPLGLMIPSPCDTPSIAYAVNKSAEVVTYGERVSRFLAPDDFKPPPEYCNYRNEFLQFLIPDKDVGLLAFDDLHVVLDKQTRPTQKLGFEEIKDQPFDLKSWDDASFQKNETYPEFKPPRNIINPAHQKRVYTAMLVSPLTEYLKSGSLNKIYGFGDAEYLQSCFDKVESQDNETGKYETDGTKLDANISSFFREFEEQLVRRAFCESHRDAAVEVHQAQYASAEPHAKFGTRLNLKYSRRSGEGGTSLFNTVDMCLVQYSALRKSGLSPKDAFKRLGVVGGDDGLMAAVVPAELLEQVGHDLHIPLKVKFVKYGYPYSFLGITRLGRDLELYSPDVTRFVYKIAYSHVKNVPLEEVLYRKCEPYVLLYPNVPLVGNMCRAVLRILSQQGFRVSSKYDAACHGSQSYVLSQFQGTQLPGPTTEEEYSLYEDYVCSELSITLTTLREVCKLYDNAKTFTDFPTGYVKSDINWFDCKYEALFRDLYFEGQGRVKLNFPNQDSDKSQAQDAPKEDEEQQQSQQQDAFSISSSEQSYGVQDQNKEKVRKIKKRSRQPKAVSCGF